MRETTKISIQEKVSTEKVSKEKIPTQGNPANKCPQTYEKPNAERCLVIL